nr:phosphate acetyltransferase [Stenoxybacter acetivorans]
MANGLIYALTQNGHNTFLFQPIGSDAAVSLSQAENWIAAGHDDDLIENITAQFNKAAAAHDVTVIKGLEPCGERLFLANKNAQIANVLNARVILTVTAQDTAAATIQRLKLAKQAYANSPTEIAGYILNFEGSGTDAATYLQHINDQFACGNWHPQCLGVLPPQAEAQSVAEHLNHESLKHLLNTPVKPRLTPPVFRLNMLEQARAAAKRIILPEGSEPRTVEAAIICHQKGIARCVLLAKPEEVAAVVKSKCLELPADLEIIDPDTIRTNYVAPMVEFRKSKGLTAEAAAEQLKDTVVLGTMMLALDEVDGLVSGAVHTTANTIRPALQLIKTTPDAGLVSSVFFMLMPDQVLVYGDCAVNPNPTSEELAIIAIQSADSAKAFGIEPKVAMISYSTGTSGAGPDVEKVAKAVELVRTKRPDLLIDGPLQYDAASVPSVGKSKAPDSAVAGQATVFVFPDLNTGNTTYKAVQRSANVLSVGPMLQGLNKPVNDLSRGALVDDIVYTIALTAIQATQKN